MTWRPGDESPGVEMGREGEEAAPCWRDWVVDQEVAVDTGRRPWWDWPTLSLWGRAGRCSCPACVDDHRESARVRLTTPAFAEYAGVGAGRKPSRLPFDRQRTVDRDGERRVLEPLSYANLATEACWWMSSSPASHARRVIDAPRGAPRCSINAMQLSVDCLIAGNALSGTPLEPISIGGSELSSPSHPGRSGSPSSPSDRFRSSQPWAAQPQPPRRG